MANPVLKQNAFSYDNQEDLLSSSHVMTTNGTLLKTCILGLLVALTFSYTWYLQMAGFADKVAGLRMIGGIGAIIMVLIISFGPKNRFLPITTSLYALFEGLLLGSISAMFNKAFPGVVPQAALGTIFTVFGMYILYSTNIIKATEKFYKIVFISTFAIMGIYLTQFILNFFHMTIPGLFSNSLVGIGFSIFCIAIASLNLIIDFDIIDRFSNRVPSYFEWYGGFSLMVTIIWLYIEILELLFKIQSRR